MSIHLVTMKKRAPSSRAWSLLPVAREAGKRNAEGLSAKLTEGVRRASRARVLRKISYDYTRQKEDSLSEVLFV